ncbi:MAG: hypothetical protein RL688_1713, partial [Actinomycetota bacterium]
MQFRVSLPEKAIAGLSRLMIPTREHRTSQIGRVVLASQLTDVSKEISMTNKGEFMQITKSRRYRAAIAVGLS